MVNNHDEFDVVQYKQNIARDKLGSIVSRNQTKTHRFLYDKRILLDDLDTISYGF